MVTIRPATPSDAAALAALAEGVFRDTFATGTSAADMNRYCAESFGPKIQQKEILDTGFTTLLGEIDSELVAYAQLKRQAANDCVVAERPSELRRLYVTRQWQGQGVAAELMEQILAAAANAGADYLWLGVWEQNPRAIAFYCRYGLVPVGEKIFQLGSDVQRDLILGMALLPG